MTTTPLPTLASISNFRELGGLPAAGGTVAHGTLYRSAHLAGASDDDLAVLAALGIRTIVDLRTDADHTGDGGLDRVPDGVAHHRIPVVDSSGRAAEMRAVLVEGDSAAIAALYGDGRAEALAREGVVEMALDPEKTAVFTQVLEHVERDVHRPVLWHCSAGKDRAGWAATLVAMTLGVPDDALMDHYLESNRHRPVQARIDHYAALGVDASPLRAFMEVRAEYLQAALDAIDAAFPSRAAYLETVHGFDAARVDGLRAELVV